jgi:hypothetical protein
MPFTLAHAAATVPLLRLLGSRGVFSALVIGSMAPDFAYFLPLGVRRGQSHGLAARALLWVVVAGAFLSGAAHGAVAGRFPNLPVSGAPYLLWGTIIGGFQGLFGALVGLGLAWRLGALRILGWARADAVERPR